MQKLKRSGGDYKKAIANFIEEVADVAIMCEQMKHYIGGGAVEKAMHEKLCRELNRINEKNIHKEKS